MRQSITDRLILLLPRSSEADCRVFEREGVKFTTVSTAAGSANSGLLEPSLSASVSRAVSFAVSLEVCHAGNGLHSTRCGAPKGLRVPGASRAWRIVHSTLLPFARGFLSLKAVELQPSRDTDDLISTSPLILGTTGIYGRAFQEYVGQPLFGCNAGVSLRPSRLASGPCLYNGVPGKKEPGAGGRRGTGLRSERG
ncbi:hypothetical protein VUR80DRAFT_8397 [Thermomyces stellatus]